MMIAWTLNVVSKKNSVFAQQPNAALSGKVIWVQNSVWKGETRILKFCFPDSESLPFSCVYISRGIQEIVHDLEKSKIQSRIWESPQHVPILTHAYPEYISHSNIYFTIMVSSIPRSFKWSAYSDSATKTLYLLFFSLSLTLSVSCMLHVPAPSHPLRSVHHYSTWRFSSEGIAERETTWKQKRTITSLHLIVISAFKIPCALHIISFKARFSSNKILFQHSVPASQQTHFLVRFESLIVMLMTTRLYLNVMQCRLVYKYHLSPVSDSSSSWKLGQSLSWRWHAPWKCCYFYAPVHVFTFKTNGKSTHDLHYKIQLFR